MDASDTVGFPQPSPPFSGGRKKLGATQGAPNSLCERQLEPFFCYAKGKSADLKSRFARATRVFPISEGPIPGPSGRQFLWETVRKLTGVEQRNSEKYVGEN